jgi:hypothetical protein
MAAVDHLAETEAERACLAELRRLAGEDGSPMELHCARMVEIVGEIARRHGSEIDRELVGCAAWLHDAGIYPEASTGDVYVRDGRRLAERVLEPFGWPADRLERCGDAIEFHHELRSQWGRGEEVELMRLADRVEVFNTTAGTGLDGAWYRDLKQRMPRTGFYRGIGGLIVTMARERPRTMPRILRPR